MRISDWSSDVCSSDLLEEIIDEIKDVEREEVSGVPISGDERVMLSNILRLRHLTAYDVMVPRADIVAVDLDTPLDELIDVMSGAGPSRLPVYRDTLDEVVGIVHIKDLLHDTPERKESGGFALELGRARWREGGGQYG